MKYVLPTLLGEKRKIRSAVRLSPRPFPIDMRTKECIVERSVEDFLSPRNTTVEILDFTRFCKSFYVIFQRDRIFWKNRFRPKTYTAYQTIYPLRPRNRPILLN